MRKIKVFPPNRKADVFISHASEDKDDIARPLAEALRRQGLTVWYDEYVLRLGDSLRQAIDRGLSSARFGIVVLTPAFFSKKWPQRELNGLLAREMNGAKILLPVWHNVTADDVVRFSPVLADKWAVSTAKGLDVVVGRILDAINTADVDPELRSSSPQRQLLAASSRDGYISASEPSAMTMPSSSPKPTCYLSCSPAHEHLLDPMRRLLEVLEFEVNTFERNAFLPSLDTLQKHIDSADVVVGFLGPNNPLKPPYAVLEPAHWTEDELLYARALRKPLVVFCDSAEHPLGLTENIASSAIRFDFGDADSLWRNTPQIVHALQNLKRYFQLPKGNAPYLFAMNVQRYKVCDESLVLSLYHEVIARQVWDVFHHSVDIGLDVSEHARIELLSHTVEFESFFNGMPHRAELSVGQLTDHELEYYVQLKPGLKAGEKFGYRPEFILQNWFPLTKTDLEKRATKPGFPGVFRSSENLYYGDACDIFFEMDSTTIVFEFAADIKVVAMRALALTLPSRSINRSETNRCNGSDFLTFTQDAQNGQRILSLSVRRPLINHSYVLLYGL